MESNLEQGRIRLIVEANSIRPEIRRMIEYLNSEMKNAEVLGLELHVYGEEEGQVILAPRIIDQTQTIADLRKPSSGGVNWSSSLLREASQDMPNEEASPLIALLDWTVKNVCFLQSRAESPNFCLARKSGHRIFCVSHSGILYLFFEEHRYPDGSIERDQLVAELKDLTLITSDIDTKEVVSGRNFIRKLSDLDTNEFDKFLHILHCYCRTLNRSE